MTERKAMKDLYAIYLVYAMGWSESFEMNAGTLLAARLGRTYCDDSKIRPESCSLNTLNARVNGGKLLSRIELRDELRKMNCGNRKLSSKKAPAYRADSPQGLDDKERAYLDDSPALPEFD